MLIILLHSLPPFLQLDLRRRKRKHPRLKQLSEAEGVDRFDESVCSPSMLECVVKYIGRRDAIAIVRQLGYIPPNVESVAAREQVPPYTHRHNIIHGCTF